MRGVAKIIDELGLMLLAKELEVEELKKEVDELRELLDIVDQHLNA